MNRFDRYLPLIVALGILGLLVLTGSPRISCELHLSSTTQPSHAPTPPSTATAPSNPSPAAEVRP